VTREIQVQCLPTDIPEHIDIDVSELMLHQSVRVKDLATDPKWKAITDGETMLVHVVVPKAEEAAATATAEAEGVAAPVAAAGTTAEPEVIKKGKTEKEEEAPKK
jgi:large subunit ribosomal protein L25